MKKISICISACALLFFANANAENIVKNTAQMQAMDKITGRVSVINVPVGGMVKFGSFAIVVRDCQTRPAEETPDNFAFVDISDTNLQGEEYNIFKGWMISSSPATSAVEHPIYDVWLLKCTDTNVDKKLLLSRQDLDTHDALPKLKSNQPASHLPDSAKNSQINVMEYENENADTNDADSENMTFDIDEAEETEISLDDSLNQASDELMNVEN